MIPACFFDTVVYTSDAMASPRIFMAFPTITWSALRLIVRKAYIIFTPHPAATPASIPRYGFFVKYEVIKPTIAPTDIMPSSPILVSPHLSENISPVAPSNNGGSIRMVAIKRPVRNVKVNILFICLTSFEF